MGWHESGNSNDAGLDARALVSLADGADALTTALERLFDAHREDAGIRAEALATLATLAPASPRASRTLLYLSRSRCKRARRLFRRA